MNKNSMQSNKLQCSNPSQCLLAGLPPGLAGFSGASSGTFGTVALLSWKWILNTLCNLWGYLHGPHFVFPEYDRLPVDCLLCKITDMEHNVSCSWSITLTWYSPAHVSNNHKKQSGFFFNKSPIKIHLFKFFQSDVKVQKKSALFQGDPLALLLQPQRNCYYHVTIVTTFNHGINHSSKIISYFYKVFNLKTPSWVLFPTSIDMQTTAKAPLFPCTAEPRGWRKTSITSAMGSSFKEATRQNRTWHGRCERCSDHL